MTIGIVGFGNFGQFLAKRFLKHGHRVLAASRTDYRAQAQELGVEYFMDMGEKLEIEPLCPCFM